MKRINNKGFTLVELIATIVILALVMSIGTISITAIINASREKEYELLIKEIKGAVELFYQECTYSEPNAEEIDCPTKRPNGYYYAKLGDLIKYGYLKGNSTVKTGANKAKFTLVNPKKNNNDITDCQIRYKYENNKIIVETQAQNVTKSCPQTIDYKG